MSALIPRVLTGIGRNALALSILTAVVVCSSTAQEPNLHPRTAAATSATNEALRDQLSLHMAPLRVNEDLDLVPVTVLDQLNLPVLRLTKNDVTLLEGDTSRDIR